MDQSVITVLLVAIAVCLAAVAYWAVTRRGTGSATGTNAGGDPHALSADSAAVVTRQAK